MAEEKGGKFGREYFIALAGKGLRMPIGTDLVLKEKPDHAAIVLDGKRLGAVVEESARRWKTPLAIPLMDLTLEKEFILGLMGVPAAEAAQYHFHGVPEPRMAEAFEKGLSGPLSSRMQAHLEAIRYVAGRGDLVPAGMTIGPFSLMTKLLEDAIPAVYMSGSGMEASDTEEVAALDSVLDLSMRAVLRSVASQLDAGARFIVVAEPAGSSAYLSPKQVDAGSDVFDRLVVASNRRIADLVRSRGAELFFHCCGELCGPMVRKYADLHMTVFSLGSSRTLWEDAALVPKDVVLYGNLPTKRFYAESMSKDEVRGLTRDLLVRMKATGHPFILGSECDVLSVPGKERAIAEKVEAFLSAT